MSILARVPFVARVPLVAALLMVWMGVIASQQVLLALNRVQDDRIRELANVHVEALSVALGPYVLRQGVWDVYDTLTRASGQGNGRRICAPACHGQQRGAGARRGLRERSADRDRAFLCRRGLPRHKREDGKALFCAAGWRGWQAAGKAQEQASHEFWINNVRANIFWQNQFLDQDNDFIQDRFPYPFVEMHQDDMERLGIGAGDLIEIANENGAAQGMAYPTDICDIRRERRSAAVFSIIARR
jgi:Molydopterin dinucleotide binding domain